MLSEHFVMRKSSLAQHTELKKQTNKQTNKPKTKKQKQQH
jgi:hypothetical protein